MKKRYLALYFLTYVFIALIALLLVGGFYISNRRTASEVSGINSFRSVLHDPETNIISKGELNLPFSLKDENLSFKSPTGNNIYLSPTGTKEYECNGICECNNDRRVTAAIPIILAATSTFLAVSIGQKYFQEQCKSQLLHSCSEEDITSTVEECKAVDFFPYEEDVERFEKSSKYWCTGKCSERSRIPGLPENSFEEEKSLAVSREQCPKVDLGSIISIHPTETITPERKFQDMNLDFACKEYSHMVSVMYIMFSEKFDPSATKSEARLALEKLAGEITDKVMPNIDIFERKDLSLCQGPPGDMYSNEINPSIRCERTKITSSD